MSPDHKCASALQLHALQEVCGQCVKVPSLTLFFMLTAHAAQIVSFFDTEESVEPESKEQSDQAFLLMSNCPCPLRWLFPILLLCSSKELFRGTLSISCSILGAPTSSFLDAKFASLLLGVQQLFHPTSVKVVNGGSLPCTLHVPNAEWSINGFSFHSTLKFIPIGSYDMILGMEWLHALSPM